MTFSVEDLEDQKKFRLFQTIPYTNLIQFVFEYLKKKSGLHFSLLVSMSSVSVLYF